MIRRNDARATGQPVLVDPFDDRCHAKANIGVFGHSGAGKTYLLKTKIQERLDQRLTQMRTTAKIKKNI